MTLKQLIKRILGLQPPVVEYRSSTMVRNLGLDPTREQLRVAVVYINYIFQGMDVEILNNHTNNLESAVIHQTFLSLGYVVDSYSCAPGSLPPDVVFPHRYDLILGFGDTYRILAEKFPQAQRVMLLTEMHPSFAQRQEERRVGQYNMRTGSKALAVRGNRYFKEGDFVLSEFVIHYGDLQGIEHGEQFRFPMNPTGLKNPHSRVDALLKSRNPRKFIWFGSHGILHKGLDLAVEAVALCPDLFLDIYGAKEEELEGLPALRAKILSCPRIRLRGFINVQAEAFLQEVVAQSYFLLLPSCSEGMATSVLTGMRHGLIPVVYVENGFSRIAEHCLALKSEEIETLAEQLLEFSQVPIEDLERRAKAAEAWAEKEATLRSFKERFLKILESIRTYHA